MKKAISYFWGIIACCSLISFTFASNYECINLGNNRLCVNVEKHGNTYSVERNIDCKDASCGVRCDVITENTIYNVGGCNSSFTYNGNGNEELKINVMVNGIYGQIYGNYDFNRGRWNSTNTNSSDNYYDDDNDEDDDYDYNDYLDVSAYDTSLSTSEFVKLFLNTDYDYVGKVNFSLKYRSSTSNSRSSISRTNSTYVSNYSSVWSNGYYRMTSSDDGEKTLSNLVKFKKTGYYRITVTDDDNNSDYIDIHVSSNSSSSNSNLDVSAYDTSLSTSEFVKLFLNTDYDYVGKVNFSVKYRSSTSSSRLSITRTNSTYISNYSSVWSNGYYKMTSSDDGKKTLSNLVKFKKAGYYRITITDDDNNSDYIDIHVSSNSSSSNSNLDVSAYDTSLSTSEFVKLFLNTDYDYVGKVNFSVKYRSSTSSSRLSITRTNSTYISNYSSVWSNGYYKMTSSDDGEKTLSNLVKFKKTGYYRITVTDDDNNSDYIDIHVSSNSSSSNSNLDVSAYDTSLSTSEFVKLFLNTDYDYVGKVNFSLKYRSSTSNSRSSISRTNSTYISNYSSIWSNGYYRMTSSDDGEKTLSNLVKFKKTGYYRITVTDDDNNSDYIDIHVSSNSSSSNNYEVIDGFTDEQYEMIKRIYNIRPSLMAQLKQENPILKNNSSWINLTNNFYLNLADVVNDVYDRKFKDYDDFMSSFNIRYNRTINLIK